MNLYNHKIDYMKFLNWLNKLEMVTILEVHITDLGSVLYEISIKKRDKYYKIELRFACNDIIKFDVPEHCMGMFEDEVKNIDEEIFIW